MRRRRSTTFVAMLLLVVPFQPAVVVIVPGAVFMTAADTTVTPVPKFSVSSRL